MTDTKTLDPIRGIAYTIKRFSFEEGSAVEEFIETHQGKLREQQAFIVFTGTVEPKFETIEDVGKADKEVVVRLWYEIQTFNTYDTTFLSLLKSLSPPGAQPDATSPR